MPPPDSLQAQSTAVARLPWLPFGRRSVRATGMSGLSDRRYTLRAGWLALLCVVTVAAYFPGLNGPFVLDDLPNITETNTTAIAALDVRALWLAANGAGDAYPERGISRMSFALNYYLAGQSYDTFSFKVTNLAIHLLNGVLVFWLVTALIDRRRRLGGASQAGGIREPRDAVGLMALVATAIWLLHPIQLTNVLYVVQRMNSLAATFVLLGLLAFVIGRARLEDGARVGWLLLVGGVGGAAALGFLCKENALLLPFFAFVIELFMFDRTRLSGNRRRVLWGYFALTVFAPIAVASAVTVIQPSALFGGYVARPFTLAERVLTEGRVLFFYLSLVIAPILNRFGLFHDDIPISTDLLDPWTTALAAAAWLALIVLSLTVGRKRRAWWAFAVLWYLAGHAMESTVLGLELVFEHRNYLPMIGPFLAGVVYLRAFLLRTVASPALRGVLVGLLLAGIGFTTYVRAHVWQSPATLSEFWARAHPKSERSQFNSAVLERMKGSDIRDIYRAYRRAARVSPSAILPLLEMVRLAAELAPQTPRRSAERTPGGGFAPPPANVLDAEPVANQAYLAVLMRRLDAETRARLMRYPISMETVTALMDMSKCTRNRMPNCIGLTGRILQWHRIALANPRLSPGGSAMLEDSLGRLYSFEDRYADALVHAKLAIAKARPSMVFNYQAALVAFYMERDRWPDAARALQRLENGTAYSPYRARVASLFRNALRDAHAKAQLSCRCTLPLTDTPR